MEWGFLVLARSRHQIFFFQHLLAIRKSQRAGQLPPALLKLLGETRGTTGGSIEVRLETIIDTKEQVDGANGFAGGDDVLHVRYLLQVEGAVPAGNTRQSTA